MAAVDVELIEIIYDKILSKLSKKVTERIEFIQQSRQAVFTMNLILFLHLATHKPSCLYIFAFVVNNLCIPLSLSLTLPMPFHSCPLLSWCKLNKRLGPFQDSEIHFMNTNCTKIALTRWASKDWSMQPFSVWWQKMDVQRFIQ